MSKNFMRSPGRIIFTFVGLMILGLLVVLFLRQPAPEPSEYLFDYTIGPAIDRIKESKAHIAAIKTQAQKNDGADETSDAAVSPTENPSLFRDLFSQMIVGSGTTLHYFTWLGHEYRHAASREDHLAQVRERIFSQFPPDEAGQLFARYKQYLDCEIAVADLVTRFGPVTSTEKGLALLREVQEFRRDYLGRELADNLFGERVKEKEYSVRRTAIINDSSLYAEEKQEQLDRLTQDMWGESDALESSFHKTNAYTRYREALAINQKDLDEIDGEADRQAAIDDIRHQYLSPDAIERIQAMERQQTEQQQQEQAYHAAEERISEDTTLSEEDKAEQIDRLRQEMLGDQAEAMKRRETIESTRQKRLRELESASDPGP